MKEVSVLIVDDEVNILNALKRVFINAPFAVYTTTDPEEASKVLEKEKIKVVVADRRMLNANGLAFLQKVKQFHSSIRRIEFTGYTDFKSAEDAVNKDEVYRIIAKPWDDEELKTVIEEAIKQYDICEEERKIIESTREHNEELKSMNEQLKALYEAQVNSALAVLRGLKTPLEVSKAAVNMVSKSLSQNKTGCTECSALVVSQNTLCWLQHLVESLIDLTELSPYDKKLEMQEEDLNKILLEVVAEQTPKAEKKGLRLIADMDDGVHPVKINSKGIGKVVRHLIDNAIKFTEYGTVTVICRQDSGKKYIKVTVMDTGCGIYQEDMPKLFMQFQQFNNRVLERTDGVGLGLAICKAIIDRHHGKIWADSEPGKGSSFNFILPVVERRSQ